MNYTERKPIYDKAIVVVIIKRKKLSGFSSRFEIIKRAVEIHIANIAKLTHAYLIYLYFLFFKGQRSYTPIYVLLCECCRQPHLNYMLYIKKHKPST